MALQQQKKFIEAACYTRWSGSETENSGFGWRTSFDTTVTSSRSSNIIKNVQGLWQPLDTQVLKTLPSIWIQDEISEEIICIGRITTDKDEYNRPTYRKEIWILDKLLWKKLGASAAFLWENQEWFTDTSLPGQGEIFLKNAADRKTLPIEFSLPKRRISDSISPPAWVSVLISELLSTEKGRILIIPSDDTDCIFHVLRTLPLKIRLKYRIFCVGWHKKLLEITSDFDLVFCPPKEAEDAYKYLKDYGGKIIQKNGEPGSEAEQIVKGMFPRSEDEYEQFSKPLDIEDMKILEQELNYMENKHKIPGNQTTSKKKPEKQKNIHSPGKNEIPPDKPLAAGSQKEKSLIFHKIIYGTALTLVFAFLSFLVIHFALIIPHEHKKMIEQMEKNLTEKLKNEYAAELQKMETNLQRKLEEMQNEYKQEFQNLKQVLGDKKKTIQNPEKDSDENQSGKKDDSLSQTQLNQDSSFN
ncbi:MAG: hypothetical protein GY795_37135 [Desulfobacterales bacterium]|nr:hypothetical protein [Desulfobacterales bacterium]